MKQLFKKTGNNNFQLLTENTVIQPKTNEVVQLSNGLKKIFTEGVSEISYNKVQNMGFGFIKDIHSAKLVALEESRILAEEFGYRDDVDNKKFIKEDGEGEGFYDPQTGRPSLHDPFIPQSGNDETDLSQPEEKREVQIGKELIDIMDNRTKHPDLSGDIKKLANELIQMHGAK